MPFSAASSTPAITLLSAIALIGMGWRWGAALKEDLLKQTDKQNEKFENAMKELTDKLDKKVTRVYEDSEKKIDSCAFHQGKVCGDARAVITSRLTVSDERMAKLFDMKIDKSSHDM